MPAQIESLFLGGTGTEYLPAWHGAGNMIKEEVVTAQEAMELGGLDWTAEFRAIHTADGGIVPPDEYRGVYRVTDNRLLAVVQGRYQIIQPAELFEFMDALCRTGEAKYHTAGSLDDGKVIFATVKLTREIRLSAELDECIEPYLLGCNSFDGRYPFFVGNHDVRPVCANTVAMFFDGMQHRYKIRHTEGYKPKVEEARDLLKKNTGYLDKLEKMGKLYLATPFSDKQFTAVLDAIPAFTVPPLRVDPKTGVSNERTIKIREEQRDLLKHLYSDDPTIQNIKGTAWGALQAFTAWESHFIRSRNSRQTDEGTEVRSNALQNRAKRLLFATASVADDARKVIDKKAKIEAGAY